MFRAIEVEAFSSYTLGNLACYPPVGAAITRGFYSLPYPLHAAFRVGKGTIFLRKAGGGQNDIGQMGSLGKEYILYDEEVQLL